MTGRRFVSIRLERGRKRAMLFDRDGRLFPDNTPAEHARIESVMSTYFRAGWKAVELRSYYEDGNFDHGNACIVIGGPAIGPLKSARLAVAQ